ncbi:hypothetical protein ZIOFF_060217 [Zingiber officinale]|uniref:14-3-3 domain-containing protein n=1 Tax=Zingiber officinale TaxID=94328 RepID=A0A8J5FAF3_ZINOF|nr:hypothetical protein ZIOFF_060217 [Zingiber officinale]
MVGAMKKVVNLGVGLTAEERNLLSVGYKNVVGARRASWRILCSIGHKEEAKGNENRVRNIKEYQKKGETELSSICADIFGWIDEHLIPSASAGESSAFYYKMKADYYRYLAEFKAGNDKKRSGGTTATKVAEADLAPSHPVRLGLTLIFLFPSKFVYQNTGLVTLQNKLLIEAISELDTLSEESYKDSTLIMQLLRDNLTLWTSDIPEDGGNY